MHVSRFVFYYSNSFIKIFWVFLLFKLAFLYGINFLLTLLIGKLYGSKGKYKKTLNFIIFKIVGCKIEIWKKIKTNWLQKLGGVFKAFKFFFLLIFLFSPFPLQHLLWSTLLLIFDWHLVKKRVLAKNIKWVLVLRKKRQMFEM